MDYRDVFNAGSDILDAVSNAVETNNYNGLGDTIKTRVTVVTSEFAKDVSNGAQKLSDTAESIGSNMAKDNNGNRQSNPSWVNYRSANNYNYNNSNNKVTDISTFVQKRVSRFSGTGRVIGGIFGAIFTGAGLITFTVLGIVLNFHFFIGTALFGLGTAAFVGLASSGSKLSKLIRHYYEYGKIIGKAEYLNIKEFAAKNGLSEKKLTKELSLMMKNGYLPHARMDENKSTLMLTDRSYQQYIDAEESRKKREEDEQNRRSDIEASNVSDNVKRILEEGNLYLKKVREVNDIIPDTDEMSDKLYRLEDIMHKIFERVQKQPQNAPDLRKFMDYYLPTTTKLLNAYVELDKQPDVGNNIIQTKKEISDTMDTINDAFEKLLDSLFQDVAWDISSDISVMKTMMAQDGLTDDNKVQ